MKLRFGGTGGHDIILIGVSGVTGQMTSRPSGSGINQKAPYVVMSPAIPMQTKEKGVSDMWVHFDTANNKLFADHPSEP